MAIDPIHDLAGLMEKTGIKMMPENIVLHQSSYGNSDEAEIMKKASCVTILNRLARLVKVPSLTDLIISISRAGEMLNMSLDEMRTLIRAWKVL